MGKSSKKMSAQRTGSTGASLAAPAQQAEDAQASSAHEARFLAALQSMMGDIELTDDSVREAIGKLTPEQKRQLMQEAGGQELKRDMLTKEENKEDRSRYFSEVNRSAEQAGLPIDKDNEFIAKKLSAFMQGSAEEIPQLLLEEALASTPYLVKAALAEAQAAEGTAQVLPADLEEIETALSLLKVAGWREGESAGRSPVVRRNLLLLHVHLHRDRLNAITLNEGTVAAVDEVISKSRRLLDVLLAYTLQLQWAKPALAVTALQALLVNGLWNHVDDECKVLMKAKLAAVGLKAPKMNLRCSASDVLPGDNVVVKVDLTRVHASSPEEMEAYRKLSAAAEGSAPTSGAAEGDAAVDATGGVGADGNADANEGWWLLAESIRALPGFTKAGMYADTLHHNVLIARQTLAPSLDEASSSTELEFEAPSSPGEYKIIVHVRSSSMVGYDVKRKVSFTVKNGKRSQPSTTSGTSTEDSSAESMEAMEAAIAEIDEAKGEEREETIEEEGAADSSASPQQMMPGAKADATLSRPQHTPPIALE